ncbi:hypothetical protein GCM10027048_42210 [Hymenobacter coalescens]
MIRFVTSLCGLLAAFIAPCASAQGIRTAQEPASDSWKERGVTLGLNYGRYLFAEVGHYRSYVYRMGALPLYSTAWHYGCEVSYLDRLVIAPKVQARVHVVFANVGLAPVLYTDFDAVSLKLRPEIGFSLSNVDVNYGYNAGVVNNEFDKASRHLVALRYYLVVKKRSHREYNHQGKRIR